MDLFDIGNGTSMESSISVVNSTDVTSSSPSDVVSPINLLLTHRLWWKHIGLAIIATFAIIGNALLIFTIARTKHLRTVTHAFIVSLATSDLLLCFPLVPIHILAESATGGHFGLSLSNICLISMSLTTFQLLAAVFSLFAITIERYVCILHPLKHRKWSQPRFVVMVIGGIWLYCALFGAIPMMGWNALRYYNPWKQASAANSELTQSQFNFSHNATEGIMSPEQCTQTFTDYPSVLPGFAPNNTDISSEIKDFFKSQNHFKRLEDCNEDVNSQKSPATHANISASVLLTTKVPSSQKSKSTLPSTVSSDLSHVVDLVPRCHYIIAFTGQYLGLFIMLNLMPIYILMPYMYWRMFWAIRRFILRKMSQSNHRSSNDLPHTGSTADLPNRQLEQQTMRRTSRRSLRLLGVLVIYSVFSWMPNIIWFMVATKGFTLTHMTQQLFQDIPISMEYYEITSLLGFTSSLFNPYIYGLGNVRIRRAFFNMFRNGRCFGFDCERNPDKSNLQEAYSMSGFYACNGLNNRSCSLRQIYRRDSDYNLILVGTNRRNT